MTKYVLKKFKLTKNISSLIPAFAGMTKFIAYKKLQIWCRLCLTKTDSAQLCVECLSWTQDAPKLELFNVIDCVCRSYDEHVTTLHHDQ